jgi:hypothetical protein
MRRESYQPKSPSPSILTSKLGLTDFQAHQPQAICRSTSVPDEAAPRYTTRLANAHETEFWELLHRHIVLVGSVAREVRPAIEDGFANGAERQFVELGSVGLTEDRATESQSTCVKRSAASAMRSPAFARQKRSQEQGRCSWRACRHERETPTGGRPLCRRRRAKRPRRRDAQGKCSSFKSRNRKPV